ncbi:MAG: response regulator transcription factor [Saprospiraceae bacterium]|nr:response regulator transcription factor [Saprospiraceae bacterium]
MFKIAVFDDQQFVVDSIITHFKSLPKVDSIVGFNRIDSLFTHLALNDIDIVISDVLTDDDIGLSLFEKLWREYPKVKVIAFSGVTSEFVKKCLHELGIIVFINKKESLDHLYEAVMEAVFRSKIIVFTTKIPTLTNKERLIAYQLAKGSTAQEIADATGNSINTVNNQKNDLIKKYKCANATELIVKLSQLGLITL